MATSKRAGREPASKLSEFAADLIGREKRFGARNYDPLPVVVDAREASRPGAPLLFDAEPTNVVATYTIACGDVERALREADVVVRESLAVQRHTAVTMETRGAVAEYDPGRRVLSMWGMTKVPHWNRGVIAEHVGLP